MYSSGFKSVRAFLSKHGWLFKDTHAVTLEKSKLSNVINAF